MIVERRRAIPPAVWVAFGGLCVVTVQAALSLVLGRPGRLGWAMWAFAGWVWALLAMGLLRGSRLAWLWGRYLTLVLAASLVARVVVGLARREFEFGVLAVSLTLAVPLIVTGFALGRPSAYAYYGLVCPACGSRTGLGADFLFQKARCRRCRNVW